jgi:hypothetical protein
VVYFSCLHTIPPRRTGNITTVLFGVIIYLRGGKSFWAMK